MIDAKNNSNDSVSIQKLDASEAIREQIPYTTLSNKVLQHLCNPEALAAWCYLQSMPPRWLVVKENIRKHFGWGINKINEVFALLKKLMLIEYSRERKKDGTLGEIVIIIKNGDEYNPASTTHMKTMLVESTTHMETIAVENHAHGFQGTINTIRYINTNKSINTTYVYPETIYPSPVKNNKTTSNNLIVSDMCLENPHNIPIGMLEEWATIRRKKRSPITPTVWKMLNKQLGQCNCGALAAFEEMISRGWQTVKPEWVNDKNEVGQFKHDKNTWGKDIREDLF